MAGDTSGNTGQGDTGKQSTNSTTGGHRRRLFSVILPVATLVGVAWPIYDHFHTSHDEVRGVVHQLEDALSTAKTGRVRLTAVVADVQHCRIWPARAADNVRGIAEDDRSALLTAVSAIGQPSNPDAQELIFDFRTAILYSAKADQHYAVWLDGLTKRYYTQIKPQNCALPVGEDSYQRFQAENTQATNYKQKFVRLFNRIAASYGVKHDWEWGKI